MSKEAVTFVVSGNLINVLDLPIDQIRAVDIAWGLAHTNRYNGQTSVPWDVLSHTGLVNMLYVQEAKGNIDHKVTMSLMLHDAAEAYIGDMIGRLKSSEVGDLFRELDKEITHRIFMRFGLNPEEVDWALIDRYDHQATAIEIAKFFPEAYAKDTRVSPPPYRIENPPALCKGKVDDYMSYMRHLAINLNVENIQELFSINEAFQAILSAPTEVPDGQPQPADRVDVSAGSDPIESMRI